MSRLMQRTISVIDRVPPFRRLQKAICSLPKQGQQQQNAMVMEWNDDVVYVRKGNGNGGWWWKRQR